MEIVFATLIFILSLVSSFLDIIYASRLRTTQSSREIIRTCETSRRKKFLKIARLIYSARWDDSTYTFRFLVGIYNRN